MPYLAARLRVLLGDRERGATLIQYGLLVALVSAAVMATVSRVGNQLDELYGYLNTQLK